MASKQWWTAQDAERLLAGTSAVVEPVWKNTVDTVRIYDEHTGRAPVGMHDASRPFVVMYSEHRDYRKGGGIAWRMADRYESLAQAKRRAYRL